MYPIHDPHYHQIVAHERLDALRRAAGDSRLRREVRRQRRRERAGPRH